MGKQLRYLEIARILKNKIRTGAYPHGRSLPSQKELSEIFSTSVMTIRQALAVLEEEGLVTIIHGVGVFVSSPDIHSNTISLKGFQNEMDRLRMKIDNEIVSREYGIFKPVLNTIFNSDGISFSCLTRLRNLDGIPVILQRSYVVDENKSVIKEYHEEKSLYQFFTEKTNTMIIRGREIIVPVLLQRKELELLHLEDPCPAFQSRRVSVSLEEKVVLYDEAYLPGQYVFMAATKQGRSSRSKYIINKAGNEDSFMSFNDTDLWEDLV